MADLGGMGHRYLHRLPPTPLVPVRLDPDDPPIWCKLEFLNPSGSTKDRIARHIIENARQRGSLRPNDAVVEASSGSTSIAMALACAQLGLRFIAVMPEGVPDERLIIIRSYGGEVRFTPRQLGLAGAIAETERLANDGVDGLGRGRVFLPRQFANPDNPDAHRRYTAREILAQIPGGEIDLVVSGVGTGGTLVGLFEGFRDGGSRLTPVLAKPVNLARTSEMECSSCSFSQRIPGVVDSMSRIFSDTRLPGLIAVEVEDNLALATTRRLIRAGFPVGPSSGLNYAAAVAAARTGPLHPSHIVTVFPDRMERYFTTELFDQIR